MVRLADLTTLRVGGPARSTLVATTDEDLISAVRDADRAAEPVLLVAGGSNLLVADEGFAGLVVLIRTQGIDVLDRDSDTATIRLAAGQSWDGVVARAVHEGWSGIEALSGIPGSAGATPIQNVGAYGAEISNVLVSIEALDRISGRIATLTADELDLGYRSSRLKCGPARWVVLGVTLRLPVDRLSAPIQYAELARRLSVDIGHRVELARVREAVIALRRGKGMVLDANDYDSWSAGSFFTNPILSVDDAAALPDGAPRFPQKDGRVKTSAAWLISNSGFERGYALPGEGRASLSTKHALALTNRGDAEAEQILALARHVRAGVQERFGITLENEPVLVGCSL